MSDKEKTNPHAGHRNRMRERFLKEGASSFEKHELLELILYNGIPMKNTNLIAHRLLKNFDNSLFMLFNSDYRDIVEKGGVSINTAIFLSAIGDTLRRCQMEKLDDKISFNNLEKSGEYIVNLLKYETSEKFYMICLDAKANLIKVIQLGKGSQTNVHIELKDVVREALLCKAASVIFAHNHPAGTLYPSGPDIDLTIKLKEALDTMNIIVVDHIVVANEDYFSFVKEGIMKKIAKNKKGEIENE